MMVKLEVTIDYYEPDLEYDPLTGRSKKHYTAEIEDLARRINAAIDECNDPRIRQILVTEIRPVKI